jgi:DNA-binding MarR family transcriptional regulator
MINSRLHTALLDWSSVFMRISLNDFNRFMRSAGMSFAQMTVLMHLYYQGASEVTFFREMLQITTAGASQMIERLAQLGLVQRSEGHTDRRIRLVELTPAGREVAERSILARQAWLDALVASMPPDEIDSITAALERLEQVAQQVEARRTSLS